MSELLASYSALSASSPRSDVDNVLQRIINAPPTAVDTQSRQRLVEALIADVKATTGSQKGASGRLIPKDTAQALLAVKNLGKHPSGAQVIAKASTLSTLLSFANNTFKDDPDASCEALRCIANTLLLIEGARVTFIEKDVSGGEQCITLLEKSSTPDQIFIISRILLLATVIQSSFLTSLVDEKRHGKNIVDTIEAKLDSLTTAILSGTKMSREATTDLLKFTFNILMHYPKMAGEPTDPAANASPEERKVMGDYWSSKLDGLLPPLLRLFTTLPPTFPAPLTAPLTHVIHSLITIPITPNLKPLWFGSTSPSPKTAPSVASSSAGRASTSTRPQASGRSGSGSTSGRSSRSTSPPTTPTSSPKPSTLDRALNVLSGGRRSMSRSPQPFRAPDVLGRAHDLFDVSFSHYFPGDIEPDDISVREGVKKENETGGNIGSTIDDMLTPLVVLITRLCTADENSRARMREWLVPTDLDRTAPLETRKDTLGRCIRLLSSVYHPMLKDAVGELFFVVSDSDPSIMSSLFGYGHVAGYLFNKGIMSAPPPPSDSGAASSVPGASINPITGSVQERRPPEPEMTEEEKEAEMEKLFVLFDRLERTGAMPKEQNPIRKAIQEGKMG
ncbi:guanine nucleotide exchange factor [Schizophyllum commune]